MAASDTAPPLSPLASQEGFHEQRDVTAPLTQGRQLDLDDGEPEGEWHRGP